MTLDQFKAWFAGFAENIDYAPTRDQWDRVKAKVAEITGSNIADVASGLKQFDEAFYPDFVHRTSKPWDAR